MSGTIPLTRPVGASNEWYTPPFYIQRVRAVLDGEILLDPASSDEANQIVQARRYYTYEQDGLHQSWESFNLYLNPPYGREPGQRRSNMDLWTERLVQEVEQGSVGHALLLVTAVPDRIWFEKLWQYPICFVRRQIMFLRPGHKPEHHPYGSCFVYLSSCSLTNKLSTFLEQFSPLGHIVLP